MQQLKSRKRPAAVAPARTAGPSLLELLSVWLTIAVAIWIFVTSVNISRVGWVAIPTVDDWDRWITLVRDHYSLAWFLEQHVDHRLAAPKLLLAIDHLVFRARGWFPLLCSFCFQGLTGFILWRLAGCAYRQGRTERLMQAAVIACFIFSGQQFINFIWPFQVVFPLVCYAAAAALFALWKSATPDTNPSAGSSERDAARWISVSIAMATVATYTMANGALLWPVLLLAGVWMRVPRRWIGAIAAGAILFGATYFYHWHRTPLPVQRPPSERMLRVVIFTLAHLGSPTTTIAALRDDENFRLTFAAIFGALVAMALLIAFARLWWRRERYNSAYAALIFYCAFIASTSPAIAFGRSEGALLEAFSPRYLTPSCILWACMLLAAWPLLRRVNRVALYSTLWALMLAGIAIHQRTELNIVRAWAMAVRLGETAVVGNVVDPEGWQFLFHTPSMTVDAIDYLKRNRLSIFTEEWTRWPGMQLSQLFSVDLNPNSCEGQFEQTAIIPSTLKSGWRATGWAWDKRAERSPNYVILADDSGQIAGVALTGFPPRQPSLAALSPQYNTSAWNGYVTGRPRSITAYAVEVNERSVCPIGTLQLPRSGTEVPFGAPPSAVSLTAGMSPNLMRRGPARLCFLDSLGPVRNPVTQNVVQVAGATQIVIAGWAVDEPKKLSAGGVDVVIDDVPFSATYGIQRIDVANFLHNPDYRNSGFQLILAPSQLAKGRHSISIRVISNDKNSYYEGPAVTFAVN